MLIITDQISIWSSTYLTMLGCERDLLQQHLLLWIFFPIRFCAEDSLCHVVTSCPHVFDIFPLMWSYHVTLSIFSRFVSVKTEYLMQKCYLFILLKHMLRKLCIWTTKIVILKRCFLRYMFQSVVHWVSIFLLHCTHCECHELVTLFLARENATISMDTQFSSFCSHTYKTALQVVTSIKCWKNLN